MHRKVVAVWVSLLVITTSIVILVEIADNVVAPTTLYVGGGGAGNYSKIQWAIDNASDGDTVFVYNGTYMETVGISKTISLVGEDRNTTIIDADESGYPVYITADYVNVSGFTLKNASQFNPSVSLNSNHNTISDNIVTKSHVGILVHNSHYNNITGNNVSSNNYLGIFTRVGSSYNNITNNEVSGYMIGIWISSSRNRIIGNNVSVCSFGISSSGINRIIGNNASYNSHGIRIYMAISNDVWGNTLYYNTENGIFLEYSSWCNLTNNYMVECGIHVRGTSLRHWNTHHIDTTNIVNGRPVYYWKNQTAGSIPLDAGQAILGNCENVTVENLKINYSSVAIQLGFCKNCLIKGNNVSFEPIGIEVTHSIRTDIMDNDIIRNGYGIWLYYSSVNVKNNNISFNSYGIQPYISEYNNITGNRIKGSAYGIRFLSSTNNSVLENDIGPLAYAIDLDPESSNNSIFHNNFLNSNFLPRDNSEYGNFWDNGYPSGGNFWWDYNGFDNFKGPSQNIPGKDGIGDIPYSDITGGAGSQDNYPLMGPYKPLENYTILKQGWNLISIPLIQVEQNQTRVLGTIDGLYDAVQRYDVTDLSDPWKHHKIGKTFGNDLGELNETMSFWIHITQPGDTIFLYNGTTPTSNQTIQLRKGWNMVGYPSLTNHNRTIGLNNLEFGTDVDCIQWYDAATKTWHFMGPDDPFVPGRGYWMHSRVEAGWEVPI